MQSGQKALPPGGISSCQNILFRRRSKSIFFACFLFTIIFILFISLSATKTYDRHTNRATTVVSETRQVHECHCIVSLPATNPENNAVIGQQTRDTVNVPDVYPMQKTGDTALEDKPMVKTLPDHVLKSITLKPNFTRMINATQRVVTVDGSYILENPTLCSSVQKLDFVIIVHTSPGHEARRFAIRNTWANDGFYKHLGNARILFLLGRSKPMEPHLQTSIFNEFKKYGDILQGDFIDDYHNLTLKGVMAYKWLTERCRNANLILKVDDDISVNMFQLFIDYFPKFRSENMTIICNHILYDTMPILRQRDSKWYVNNNHFRGLWGYPTDYCSGFFVIFTNDMIPALYQSSKVTPFFWVDDVYLYGLVPGNVPGVKYIGLTGDWHQLGGQEALKCYRNETATCPFLVAGAGAPGEMEQLWPEMCKRYTKELHPR